MSGLGTMKTLAWAAVAAVAFAGCKCGEPGAPDAGAPDAGLAAPVTDTVRLMREADAAYQAGKLDEAIQKAEAALKQAPDSALALNVVGRASVARYGQGRDPKDADRARDAFTRAARANPGFWPALQNLAELAEKEGKLQEAAGYYRQVLAAEPRHPQREHFEQVISRAEGKDTGR